MPLIDLTRTLDPRDIERLPPHGFKAAFFPIKLANCSAAPARVAAFVTY